MIYLKLQMDSKRLSQFTLCKSNYYALKTAIIYKQ